MPMHARTLENTAAVPTVLIAAGGHDIRELYRISLETGGWQVDEAPDGRQALSLALERRPSIIVIDEPLPVMSGYELCQRLRRDRRVADVPIIFITSGIRPADLERARAAGASTTLQPPCLEVLCAEAARLRLTAPSAQQTGEQPTSATRGLIDRKLPAPSDAHAGSRVRAHKRFVTTRPELAPPALRCPMCDRSLTYDRSHVGGVNASHVEQWDYYVCAGSCGTFQYRQRTRKVRRV